MITKRDQDVLNLLQDFHIATSRQIHRLFFSGISKRYCLKRLQVMHEQGFAKRTRSTIDDGYAYYTDRRPVQIHHDLIRAELYTAIKSRYEILEWHNEVPVGDIRPDALCYIKHSGIVFPVLSEIHLSNGFNFDKYKMDFLPYFGVQPRVIICTDREVKPPLSAVKYKVVGLDMSGIDTLLK